MDLCFFWTASSFFAVFPYSKPYSANENTAFSPTIKWSSSLTSISASVSLSFCVRPDFA